MKNLAWCGQRILRAVPPSSFAFTSGMGIWQLWSGNSRPSPTSSKSLPWGILKDHLTRSTENANAMAPDGFGVLGLATFFGQIEAAEVLLGAGANPDTPSANDHKVRPIHSAAANRSAEKSLPLCRLLLDAGADPNVTQAGGWTPLHQASAHGRKELVELFLSHGAAVDAKSDDNRTAAEMAEAKGHKEIQALLEQAGA